MDDLLANVKITLRVSPTTDAMLEQSIKKPRLAAAAPNSGSSGGIAEGEGVSGESETNAPPVSKQAEQMLRVSFHVTIVFITGN